LILSGPVDTTIGKLHISSFESSERDISKYDNMSYLFTYKGIRVLHLGDCQADIMMINDPAHAWNLEQRYPKDCDILIMPIESTQKFILQTVKMAELLEPRVLIPTHYWSPEYKQEFIDAIEQTYSRKGKDLEIEQKHGAEFVYSGRDKEEGVLLLDLTPSAKNGK
jgi:L-ascorbate metabolism protein UlaG (beta-lactamase superfamily)